MTAKTKPKIDTLRNNVKGEKGYRWELGSIVFDKKEPCRSEKKLDTSNNSGHGYSEGFEI